MPIPKNYARFQDANRGPDLDEHDRSGGECNRDRGMQCNAQRTMISVGFQRMDVGNLDDGEKSQEGQAHHGRRHESS